MVKIQNEDCTSAESMFTILFPFKFFESLHKTGFSLGGIYWGSVVFLVVFGVGVI